MSDFVKDINVPANDCISRQAAIDELSQRYIIMDNPHYIGYNAGLDEAQKVIKAMPPVYVPDTNVGDMISRQAATTIPVMPKEHRHYQTNNLDDAYEQGWTDLQECIENLPPVQPTITHEQAIDYLHETGWLQNHDRILTESRVLLKGTWKDFTDEGYVECPFCKSATNCESKEEIDDIHFCFSCGAMLKRGEADGHN